MRLPLFRVCPEQIPKHPSRRRPARLAEFQFLLRARRGRQIVRLRRSAPRTIRIENRQPPSPLARQRRFLPIHGTRPTAAPVGGRQRGTRRPRGGRRGGRQMTNRHGVAVEPFFLIVRRLAISWRGRSRSSRALASYEMLWNSGGGINFWGMVARRLLPSSGAGRLFRLGQILTAFLTRWRSMLSSIAIAVDSMRAWILVIASSIPSSMTLTLGSRKSIATLVGTFIATTV